MLFHTPTFLLFFIIVFSLYWLLNSNVARKSLLLIASYFFYSCWDWRFSFLLLFSTVLDYTLAYFLGSPLSEKKRKALIIVSLISNLTILGFFKYFNFFVDSFMQFSTAVGIPVNYETISIILPVGISFYTFQTLSYTIDVYRQKIPAEKSFLNVALFVAFFPQLVAGPIVHAKDFMYQLYEKKLFKDIPWRACILLFMFGLVKKVVVADNIAVAVNAIFLHPGRFDSISIIVGVMLFAIQIYCDFSGYSDMAIALSRVFGFDLPMNFAWPYFSKNISEFWHRWHISLSSWWRDYFYIPLGGNREGPLKQDRNLLATMAVAGLWHGAAWTFVIWGLLHGVALVVYHRVKKGLNFFITLKSNQLRKVATVSSLLIIGGLSYHYFTHNHGPMNVNSLLLLGSMASYKILDSGKIKLQILSSVLVRKLFQLCSVVVTFWFVCLCWIYFRAASLHDATTIMKKFLLLKTLGRSYFGMTYCLVIVGLIICHYLTYKLQPVKNAEKIPTVIFALWIGLLFAIVLLAQPVKTNPFIYFQF